jgi:hypothetical protein
MIIICDKAETSLYDIIFEILLIWLYLPHMISWLYVCENLLVWLQETCQLVCANLICPSAETCRLPAYARSAACLRKPYYLFRILCCLSAQNCLRKPVLRETGHPSAQIWLSVYATGQPVSQIWQPACGNLAAYLPKLDCFFSLNLAAYFSACLRIPEHLSAQTWIPICTKLPACLRKPGSLSVQTACIPAQICLRKPTLPVYACLSAQTCLSVCANLPVPLRKPTCPDVPACRRKPGCLPKQKLHDCPVSVRC